ncbi:MAG TPA: hypothetical protein VHY48_09400 [Acidobacteriaceae bacterium]|jgi:hypothetical protein|nr:hypothetical protein [Acidobacteriaceae bacterium]
MPTNGQEGHDPLRPSGTSPHPPAKRDAEHPGYEVQDVNIRGIVTFVAGLGGFLVIFFVFCYFMGEAINYTIAKQDGPVDKWHAGVGHLGETPRGQKLEDLTSDAVMEQRALAQMTQSFPTPRLETDDGDQDVADLHAREDLLLDFYSTSPDLPAGTIRIPISRAMNLIVQQGLPKPPVSEQPAPLMAGETAPTIQAPITDGFARTAYELQTIEARAERNEFQRAEAER